MVRAIATVGLYALIITLPYSVSYAQTETTTASSQDDVPHPDTEHILIWYDFDDSEIETGPYTVSVYEGARGHVRLTSDYRLSGRRSVEIRAVAGDGTFAELQGYFPDKYHGRLYLHFAFLIVDPREPMNIAFAGLSHFSMRKDGIGLWLKTKSGHLYHVSDGEDRPLGRLEAFTWYVADVIYDIDRGRYDLRITRETEETAFIEVREQTNAVGIPGSKLRKFSFIGDPPGVDSSNVHFFVDDLIVAADSPAREAPFVAPGRRMLFVDIYDFWKKRLYDEPRCPPVLGPEDFGFYGDDVAELSRSGLGELLERAVSEEAQTPLSATTPPHLRDRLKALSEWSMGCRAPHDCEHGHCPADYFSRASALAPTAKLYPMSRVLALGAANRWREGDALLATIYAEWNEDPRFPALAGVLGVARGQLDQADDWLASAVDSVPTNISDPAIRQLWSGKITPTLTATLQRSYPANWSDYLESALVSEHRFYVLVWQEQYEQARRYAEAMTHRLSALDVPASHWLERSGDAAFLDSNIVAAKQSYEAAIDGRDDPIPLFLKLSDAAFELGDLDGERRYRERIYGRLDER